MAPPSVISPSGAAAALARRVSSSANRSTYVTDAVVLRQHRRAVGQSMLTGRERPPVAVLGSGDEGDSIGRLASRSSMAFEDALEFRGNYLACGFHRLLARRPR
jgi:hypothetical protein